MSIVDYGTATSVVSGRPSPKIWADCPVITFLKDPGKGFHLFDDFFQAPGATTVGGFMWYTYIDTNGTLTLTDSEKGILEIMTDEDDNDALVLTTGNNTTGLITATSAPDGNGKKWWFEARVACATITDGDVGLFVGLTEEGQAANTKPMADDGTHAINASVDHVGFWVSGAEGDAVDFVWNIGDGVQTAQSTDDVHTLVADEYVNLGMKYEPLDNKIHCYVNGVEDVPAAFSLTHASAPVDTMAVTIAIKADGAAAVTDFLHVDWVRVAAEY